jgi:hypothetical protein
MSSPRSRSYRIILFLLPFLVLGIHLAVMYATLSYAMFLIMVGLMAAYILPPAGKETIIPIGIALGFPWWYIALSIVMIDVETGLFMAFNFDLAYEIPYLGKILDDLTRATERFLEGHHWLAGLYFFAIVLMVMVPVLGSGGVRGSIVGRLLGMDPKVVFLAIVAGALIGCFGIALASDVVIDQLCGSGMLPPELSAMVCR